MNIGFFGDTVLDYNIEIDSNLEWIKNNDFNLINLEAPFIIDPEPVDKSINVYSEKNLEFLKKYNFNLINVANNHFFDFGKINASKVSDYLKENEFQVIGYGKDIKSAKKPIILEGKKKKIGIFSFSCKYIDTVCADKNKEGLSPFTEKIVYEILKEYEYLDFKICYFHYGVEYEDYPEPYYRNFFNNLIENHMVDLIIGTHPHCVQGYELLEKGSIFYSLGNFIFPEKKYLGKELKFPEKTNYGYFLNIKVKDKIEAEVIEYKILEKGRKIKAFNHLKVVKNSQYFSLDKKKYFKFYKSIRFRKRFPIRGSIEKVNNIKWNIYKNIERKIYKIYIFFKRKNNMGENN